MTNFGKFCAIYKQLRKECGYKGISKAECEEKNDCWKINDYESILYRKKL